MKRGQLKDNVSFPLLLTNNEPNSATFFIKIESTFDLPPGMQVAILYANSSNMVTKGRDINVALDKNASQPLLVGVGSSAYLNSLVSQLETRPGFGKISPNPFTTRFRVQYFVPFGPVDQVQFKLVNLLGQCVWQSNSSPFHSGINYLMVNSKSEMAGKLRSGMYILQYTLAQHSRPKEVFNQKVSCF
jgi:hypothetical protein